MDAKKYGALSSSVNPQELSLTVESIGKVIIGIIGWVVVSKGMDAATAQTQLQALVDLVAQAIPMAFTLWASMLTGYGIIRKFIVFLSARPVATE